MVGEWARVTRANPCPVCHKTDWCGVSATGAVCCMRVQSDKPARNGGYIHGGTATPLAAAPRRQAPAGYQPPEFDANLWWCTIRHIAHPAKLQPWADTLGLPVECLDWMGACALGAMLAFPMYDGNGAVCGIRTREHDGAKRAITGSRAGVFLPTVHMPDLDAVVCEGPTDAAAAMALGFEPIGRPSCAGCEMHVVDTCKRLAVSRITICADADAPGTNGARKLADVLRAARITTRLVAPAGHKDLRDWFKVGVSRDVVECAWSQSKWE
jgi:hypothetical protein